MNKSLYSFSNLLADAVRPHRGGTITTVSIAILLNAVIANSIVGAHRATVASGDLKHGSRVNALLGLSAQFNTVFLLFAALICVMLLYTSLGAIYDSRRETIAVLRLCGLSMRRIVRHHIAEILGVSGTAAGIGIIAFLPLAWAYGEILPVFGLAPSDTALGVHWETLLLSALGVTLFLVFLAWVKPRRHYAMGAGARVATGHRVTRIAVLVLLAAAGLLLILPASPLADDTKMMLMVPWAALVGLVYGPRLIFLACRIAGSRLRRTGTAPRLGIAIGRLETSMNSRVNPVLPLTIVLAFVVPLSAVMATGRSASVAEIYDAVNARTVADLHQDGAASETRHYNSIDEESIYIATSTDVYRKSDPYSPEQPLLGVTDVSRLTRFFPEVEVRSGDLGSVAGDVIAVSDRGRAVGDEIHVVTGDQTSCTFTVGAVVKLPSLIHFDYLGQDIQDSCPAASFGRVMAYSQRTPESLSGILDDPGWEIEAKTDWVKRGIGQTVQNQRSALIVMFLVPLLMALLVTALAMRSREALVRESNRVLAYLGATRNDFRKIAIAEATAAAVASLLFLAVATALNAIVIFPVAQAANVGVTFDYQLDAVFIGVTLIIVAAIYLRTSLKSGGWSPVGSGAG